VKVASRGTKLLRGLVGVAVLVALLELLTRAELVNPQYLPPASAILATTVGLFADPAFLEAVGGTMAGWGLGMLAATGIAVPLGILLGSSWRSYLASITTIEFLRPIPSVALIPLVIILQGRGLNMKVILITYASLWPILFNTIYGIRDVDPVAKDTARIYGFSGLSVLWRVSLPSAAPFIYTGLRISAGIALILAVSTELIAGGSSNSGIGVWMLDYTQDGAAREFLYAGTVFAGLLGLAINLVMVAGEKRLFAWHQRVRTAE
jgi:NitT/TauT family transport system permease protein